MEKIRELILKQGVDTKILKNLLKFISHTRDHLEIFFSSLPYLVA